MRKIPLLQAVCSVALLAAAPAFAQSPPPSPTDNSGNAAGGAPAAQESPPKHPAAPMHRKSAMRSGRTDSSQNADVDRLNDQSYQAAQHGQTFSGGAADTGSSGMAKPAAPADMGNGPGGAPGGAPQGGSMSGGSMSDDGATGK